jgi:CCR4-NOT transcription complex subunit 7/8
MYAEESVDLLQNSGLQFDRHEREGIETVDFAEMLIVSGMIKAEVFPSPSILRTFIKDGFL